MMFPIRRAALRLLSYSPATIVPKHRAISSSSIIGKSIQYTKTTSSINFQRRWASDDIAKREESGEQDAPISKLQPTGPEEVENAISEETDARESVEAVEAVEAADAVAAPEVHDTGRFQSSRPLRTRADREADFSKASEPKQTLYVGNLFFDVTEEDLTKEMSRFGSIKNLRLIRDARGLSKGFGYVTYESTSDAQRAINGLHQQVFEGRRLAVQFALQDLPPARHNRDGPGKQLNPPSKTLFIGNMAWEITDRDLNNVFRGVKNVVDVRVAIDRRTGQPRGFAHADFVDIKSAMEAFQTLQGTELYGRTLKLDYSYNSNSSARTQAKDEGQI